MPAPDIKEEVITTHGDYSLIVKPGKRNKWRWALRDTKKNSIVAIPPVSAGANSRDACIEEGRLLIDGLRAMHTLSDVQDTANQLRDERDRTCIELNRAHVERSRTRDELNRARADVQSARTWNIWMWGFVVAATFIGWAIGNYM